MRDQKAQLEGRANIPAPLSKCGLCSRFWGRVTWEWLISISSVWFLMPQPADNLRNITLSIPEAEVHYISYQMSCEKKPPHNWNITLCFLFIKPSEWRVLKLVLEPLVAICNLQWYFSLYILSIYFLFSLLYTLHF